jgi:hypothetical protein
MFAFGLLLDGEFVFVHSHKVVYTYSTEEEARSYFKGVQNHSHLYQIEADLSVARLFVQGDEEDPPITVLLDDEHKLGLWSSYRYRSLLDWNPEPEEINP